MMKSKSGFTIVELLVVIVVIAILAAITIVAYNGLQDRARNTALLSGMDAVEKALRLYATENGSYPQPTDVATSGVNYVCVGRGYQTTTDFPNASNGKPTCFLYAGNIYAASSTQFDTAIKTFLTAQPDVSNYIATGLPNTYAFRGIIYWNWTAPDASHPKGTATLSYIIGGSTQQPCGRGASVFGGTYTECDLYLN